jgi:RNA 3'-terminal phosphate cyclase
MSKISNYNLKKVTSVFYKPGLIVGGKIAHDCPPSRAMGYFLEPLIALAPFAKFPSQITLTGITNDNVDVSVCDLIYYNWEELVMRRGCNVLTGLMSSIF